MVKLAYSSKKMGKAECKKMFSHDIKRDVVTADALMNELRSLARHHADPSTPQVFIAQGLTDQMLASFAIKLRLPDEKLYESFDEICHDFVLVLRHMTGQPVPSRWEAGLKEEEKAKVKESDSQASLRELKEDGTFKDPAKVLAEMGFPVGSHIRRKSDKTEAVITEVVEDNVKVSIDGGFFKVSIKESTVFDFFSGRISSLELHLSHAVSGHKGSAFNSCNHMSMFPMSMS